LLDDPNAAGRASLSTLEIGASRSNCDRHDTEEHEVIAEAEPIEELCEITTSVLNPRSCPMQQNGYEQRRVLPRFQCVGLSIGQVEHAARNECLHSSVGLELDHTLDALNHYQPGGDVLIDHFASRQHIPEDFKVAGSDQGF
jgi:hypothetical protein